jgi:hypothetical protein
MGGAPVWGSQSFPKADRSGRLVTLASGFGIDSDALSIRALARVVGATLRLRKPLARLAQSMSLGRPRCWRYPIRR